MGSDLIIIESPDPKEREIQIKDKVYSLKTLTTDQAFEFADLIASVFSNQDLSNIQPAEILLALSHEKVRAKTYSLIEKSSGIKKADLGAWGLQVFTKVLRLLIEDNIDFLSQQMSEDLKVLSQIMSAKFQDTSQPKS